MEILDRYPGTEADRRPQRTKSHGAAKLLLARSKIDTPLSELLATLIPLAKKPFESPQPTLLCR
jgi:hypothetical protein